MTFLNPIHSFLFDFILFSNKNKRLNQMNKAILFKQDGCGACTTQDEFLRKNFRGTIHQINLSKFPGQFEFIEFTPTWAIPLGNDQYKLHSEIVETPEELQRVSQFGKSRKAKRSKSRRTGFGQTLLPGINNLSVYGKNFPDNQGFKTTDSFYKTIENTWGKGTDTLNAGIGGSRSLGPGNVNQMYTSGYLNDIRMAHPSDQLGTAINLNRTCNTMNQRSTMSSSTGLVTQTGNPQIVDNTTGTKFGRKRRSRFGGLYRQMGPASEIGNQFLLGKNTVQGLYGGATQFEGPRPQGIQGNTFLAQAKLYSSGSGKTVQFGKRVKKQNKKGSTPKKSKTLNVSGKKAVNIKINIKQKNSSGKKRKVN
jgi:hypothetical protein